MKKRSVISFLPIIVLASVHLADAQQTGKVPRIGLLIPSSRSAYASRVDAFRSGLRELRYVEGQNIIIESRYGEGETIGCLTLLPNLSSSR